MAHEHLGLAPFTGYLLTNNKTMKANELRIGNIHETNCFDIPREGIRSFRIDGKCYSYITGHGISLVEQGLMEFVPIPLTEDWLLKMGFELSGHQLGEEYSRGNFSMYYYNGDYPDYEGEILASCFNGNNVEIKYIHQLQNLYFALTGEELEIKL